MKKKSLKKKLESEREREKESKKINTNKLHFKGMVRTNFLFYLNRYTAFRDKLGEHSYHKC